MTAIQIKVNIRTKSHKKFIAALDMLCKKFAVKRRYEVGMAYYYAFDWDIVSRVKAV